MNNELLEKLRQPFPPEYITWKPGATTKEGNKCMALAYADLRAYQERLDEVCGLDWSIEYVPWGDTRVIARLTIGGVTRSSTGEMGTQDIKNEMGGTVAEAQAMKRAAAQFGLGRYLYDLPSVWVEFDPQRKRISEVGQKELDARYAAWYARYNTPRTAQKAQERTQPAQRSDAPTDAELAVLGTWRTPADAKAWAVSIGACDNEFEAGNSFKKIVDANGGKLTTANIAQVYLDFLRHQNNKDTQPQQAAA